MARGRFWPLADTPIDEIVSAFEAKADAQIDRHRSYLITYAHQSAPAETSLAKSAIVNMDSATHA